MIFRTLIDSPHAEDYFAVFLKLIIIIYCSLICFILLFSKHSEVTVMACFQSKNNHTNLATEYGELFEK